MRWVFEFDTQAEAERAVARYRAHPEAKAATVHYHQLDNGKWEARGLHIESGDRFRFRNYSAEARA